MRITRGPALAVGALAAVAALAGCSAAPRTTAAPARPAQCAALLAQITTFDHAIIKDQKTQDLAAELSAASAFALTLRRDAGDPAVPQALWDAETNLSGALGAFSTPGVNAALAQVKAVCG